VDQAKFSGATPDRESCRRRVDEPIGVHSHFKTVTAMSPLQYQKQLRLQEARRLMLAQAMDSARAAYEVGYQSPSQFSREYRRVFGNPPGRDIAGLKDVGAVAAGA
jgi:AraC-like DNA-binding protein